MEISSSSSTYILNVRMFFESSHLQLFLKFWGTLWAVTDNNNVADLHGSYPSGSVNVGEFFD